MKMPKTGLTDPCSALSTGKQPPVSGSPSIHICFLTLYHSQQTPHCNPSCSSALQCFSSLVCCGLLPPSDWRPPAAQENRLCAPVQAASTGAECSACAAALLSWHVLSCFWGASCEGITGKCLTGLGRTACQVLWRAELLNSS